MACASIRTACAAPATSCWSCPASAWLGLPRSGRSSRICGPTSPSSCEIEARYRGYLQRQTADIAAFRREERLALPADLDFAGMSGLSGELRQALQRVRPTSLGAAARIAGMTPGGADPALPPCPAGRLSDATADAAPRPGRCSVFHVKHWTGCRPISICWRAGRRGSIWSAPSTLADPWRRHILDSGQLWRCWPQGARTAGRSRQRRRPARPGAGGAGRAGRPPDRERPAQGRVPARGGAGLRCHGDRACGAQRGRPAARGRRGHRAGAGAPARAAGAGRSGMCTPAPPACSSRAGVRRAN